MKELKNMSLSVYLFLFYKKGRFRKKESCSRSKNSFKYFCKSKELRIMGIGLQKEDVGSMWAGT